MLRKPKDHVKHISDTNKCALRDEHKECDITLSLEQESVDTQTFIQSLKLVAHAPKDSSTQSLTQSEYISERETTTHKTHTFMKTSSQSIQPSTSDTALSLLCTQLPDLVPVNMPVCVSVSLPISVPIMSDADISLSMPTRSQHSSDYNLRGSYVPQNITQDTKATRKVQERKITKENTATAIGESLCIIHKDNEPIHRLVHRYSVYANIQIDRGSMTRILPATEHTACQLRAQQHSHKIHTRYRADSEHTQTKSVIAHTHNKDTKTHTDNAHISPKRKRDESLPDINSNKRMKIQSTDTSENAASASRTKDTEHKKDDKNEHTQHSIEKKQSDTQNITHIRDILRTIITHRTKPLYVNDVRSLLIKLSQHSVDCEKLKSNDSVCMGCAIRNKNYLGKERSRMSVYTFMNEISSFDIHIEEMCMPMAALTIAASQNRHTLIHDMYMLLSHVHTIEAQEYESAIRAMSTTDNDITQIYSEMDTAQHSDISRHAIYTNSRRTFLHSLAAYIQNIHINDIVQPYKSNDKYIRTLFEERAEERTGAPKAPLCVTRLRRIIFQTASQVSDIKGTFLQLNQLSDYLLQKPTISWLFILFNEQHFIDDILDRKLIVFINQFADIVYRMRVTLDYIMKIKPLNDIDFYACLARYLDPTYEYTDVPIDLVSVQLKSTGTIFAETKASRQEIANIKRMYVQKLRDFFAHSQQYDNDKIFKLLDDVNMAIDRSEKTKTALNTVNYIHSADVSAHFNKYIQYMTEHTEFTGLKYSKPSFAAYDLYDVCVQLVMTHAMEMALGSTFYIISEYIADAQCICTKYLVYLLYKIDISQSDEIFISLIKEFQHETAKRAYEFITEMQRHKLCHLDCVLPYEEQYIEKCKLSCDVCKLLPAGHYTKDTQDICLSAACINLTLQSMFSLVPHLHCDIDIAQILTESESSLTHYAHTVYLHIVRQHLDVHARETQTQETMLENRIRRYIEKV